MSDFMRHTESCIGFTEPCIDPDHYGKSKNGRYEGHSCDCLCHGIYLESERKLKGVVRKLGDESWRRENR